MTDNNDYWHGHNLMRELAMALSTIEGVEEADPVAAEGIKPGFWNLYLILKRAAKEGFAVTQHIVKGADVFDVWCPMTDEVAGPMDANGVAAFMQGYAVAVLRNLQKKGPNEHGGTEIT